MVEPATMVDAVILVGFFICGAAVLIALILKS